MSSPKHFRKDEVDGKVVIETTGKAFGKAKDIAFGLDGTVALIVLTDDNTEVEVTMDKVMGVADYIVIRKDTPLPKASPPPPSPSPVAVPAPAPVSIPPPVMVAPPAPVPMAPSVCRNCGAALKQGAKFCTRCGSPV